MSHLKTNLILIFTFLFLNSFGQKNTFHKVFTKQDGLEIDVIKTMCFDNDGFLWLAGDNLAIHEIILSTQKPFIQRFNGDSFHNILLPKTNSKILSVNQIYKRKDGQFYIKVKLETETLIWLFRR